MTTQNGVLATRWTALGGVEVYRIRPSVPEVAPLVRALYRRNGGGAGCCLHIVLDDDNVRNSNVAFCLEEARQKKHVDCIELAEKLVEMSTTQRLVLRHVARRAR